MRMSTFHCIAFSMLLSSLSFSDDTSTIHGALSGDSSNSAVEPAEEPLQSKEQPEVKVDPEFKKALQGLSVSELDSLYAVEQTFVLRAMAEALAYRNEVPEIEDEKFWASVETYGGLGGGVVGTLTAMNLRNPWARLAVGLVGFGGAGASIHGSVRYGELDSQLESVDETIEQLQDQLQFYQKRAEVVAKILKEKGGNPEAVTEKITSSLKKALENSEDIEVSSD